MLQLNASLPPNHLPSPRKTTPQRQVVTTLATSAYRKLISTSSSCQATKRRPRSKPEAATSPTAAFEVSKERKILVPLRHLLSTEEEVNEQHEAVVPPPRRAHVLQSNATASQRTLRRFNRRWKNTCCPPLSRVAEITNQKTILHQTRRNLIIRQIVSYALENDRKI